MWMGAARTGTRHKALITCSEDGPLRAEYVRRAGNSIHRQAGEGSQYCIQAVDKAGCYDELEKSA